MKPVYSDVSWIDHWQQRQGGSVSTAPWKPSTAQSTVAGDGIQQITEDATGLLPSSYEPGYAYPLIVWLAGRDCPVSDALGHISAMSPQNYVGLVLDESLTACRNDEARPLAFVQQLTQLEERLVEAVREFRLTANIHSERVFVAGSGEAGTWAQLLALHQPEWFGGAISFGGAFPRSAAVLARGDAIRETRFWLASPSLRTHWQSMLATQAAVRHLEALGADVATCVRDSNTLVSHSMLRELDRWIIDGILAES